MTESFFFILAQLPHCGLSCYLHLFAAIDICVLESVGGNMSHLLEDSTSSVSFLCFPSSRFHFPPLVHAQCGGDEVYNNFYLELPAKIKTFLSTC